MQICKCPPSVNNFLCNQTMTIKAFKGPNMGTKTHTLLPPLAFAEVVCRWPEAHSGLSCSWWTHKWYCRQTGNWAAGVPRLALPYWWATGPRSNQTGSFLAPCTGRTHRGFERRPVSARHGIGPGSIHPVQSETKTRTRKCSVTAQQGKDTTLTLLMSHR